MGNKGATSVLIIMLMVVLMVFGLTILTTTLSNQTLSEKKQEWLIDYYKLEGKAAEELAEFDRLLQSAKEETLQLKSDNRKETYESLIDTLLVNGYAELMVSENGQDYNKSIDIELQVLIPENSVSDDDFLKAVNYQITRYVQEQELFEYDDIEFGNPFFPKED